MIAIINSKYRGAHVMLIFLRKKLEQQQLVLECVISYLYGPGHMCTDHHPMEEGIEYIARNTRISIRN